MFYHSDCYYCQNPISFTEETANKYIFGIEKYICDDCLLVMEANKNLDPSITTISLNLFREPAIYCTATNCTRHAVEDAQYCKICQDEIK